MRVCFSSFSCSLLESSLFCSCQLLFEWLLLLGNLQYCAKMHKYSNGLKFLKKKTGRLLYLFMHCVSPSMLCWRGSVVRGSEWPLLESWTLSKDTNVPLQLALSICVSLYYVTHTHTHRQRGHRCILYHNLHASTHACHSDVCMHACTHACIGRRAVKVLYTLLCSKIFTLCLSLSHPVSDTHSQTHKKIILRICFYVPTYTSFSICHTKPLKSLFNFLSMLLLYSLGTRPIACTRRCKHTHKHTRVAVLKGDK